MKKINKVLSLIAGVALFAFASCDDGNVATIYDLSEAEQGYAFLTESAGASYGPGYTETEYTLKLSRNFAGPEATITLNNDCEYDFFTVPTSVTFAAGETLADITIGIAGMATGETYDFTLSIDSTKLSKLGEDQYGIAETAITFGVDYSWTKIGTVVATDNWSGNEAKVELQMAPEYASVANEMLVRLVSLEFMLEPDYADEGYHFLFYLDKTTYEPLGAAYSAQLMGESGSDNGNYYWMYSPSAGHTFTKKANAYSLSGYVGYDAWGETIKAGWYWYLDFTWTDGYPLDDIPQEGEEEPEEESGNGFGAIVAGGTAEEYAGTYTATYLNDGKKEATAEVTLTAVDEETVNMKGLVVDSRYELEDNGINLKLFGGLLYFEPQYMGPNKYGDVYAVAYDSKTGYIFTDMMLVAGFKENGDIQFTNYSYNNSEDVEGVDGIVYVFDFNDNTYGGSDNTPCSIVLSKAAATAPAKNIMSVVESLEASRNFFHVPALSVATGNLK
ncbi:MAG: hypothetical protein J5814_06580 [Bacteroidaceae bacterium]|nr:hypothetical protein [Bacteroidaceae bacterium]